MENPSIKRSSELKLPESLRFQFNKALASLPDGGSAKVERITSGYDVANHILLVTTANHRYIFRARQEQTYDCLENYVWFIFERAGFLGMGGNIRIRTILEEANFMLQALALGLPVPQIIYADSDWMIIEYIEGQTVYQLSEVGEYRIALKMLQELHTAHQKGVIYGDRWGGNEIVDSNGKIYMIDLDLEWTYEGSQNNVLENLEIAWFLFNSLRMSNQRDAMLNLLKTDGVPMLKAWGYNMEIVRQFATGFAEFYLNPDKPIYPTSLLSYAPDLTLAQPIERLLDLCF